MMHWGWVGVNLLADLPADLGVTSANCLFNLTTMMPHSSNMKLPCGGVLGGVRGVKGGVYSMT